MKRRQLDFRSADDVIADIQLLQRVGYQPTGNWNLTQICEHWTGTMAGGLDGFGFRAPWILRATVFQWGFDFALKRRWIGRGFPTLKRLKPQTSETVDNDAEINQCIETCRRAAARVEPIVDYPFLNDLPAADWRDFMWIHAAHHLGFLVPND